MLNITNYNAGSKTGTVLARVHSRVQLAYLPVPITGLTGQTCAGLALSEAPAIMRVRPLKNELLRGNSRTKTFGLYIPLVGTRSE